MRKLGASILLLICLTNTCTFHQLLKLPVLVSHFMEHKQRDSSVSIMQFLSWHYWGKDLNDNDDDRDRQLPFRGHDIHIAQAPYVPFSRPITAISEDARIVSIVIYPISNDDRLTDPAVSSLFRPPKA